MGLLFNPTSLAAMSYATDGREGVVSSQIHLADALGFSLMGGFGGGLVAVADRTSWSVTSALTVCMFAAADGRRRRRRGRRPGAHDRAPRGVSWPSVRRHREAEPLHEFLQERLNSATVRDRLHARGTNRADSSQDIVMNAKFCLACSGGHPYGGGRAEVADGCWADDADGGGGDGRGGDRGGRRGRRHHGRPRRPRPSVRCTPTASTG